MVQGILIFPRMASAGASGVEPARSDPTALPDGPGLLLLSSPVGSLVGSFHPLVSAETVVGRGLEAAVRVEDPGISRAHLALLRRADGGFTAVDLGSRNGTWVNGVRVRTARLSEGDRLQIGIATTFRLARRPARSAGAPSRPDPGATTIPDWP